MKQSLLTHPTVNLVDQVIIIVNLDPSKKEPKCASKWPKVTLPRLSERDEELASFKGNPHEA